MLHRLIVIVNKKQGEIKMSKYFRATGYYPKEDISFIVDSYGKFDAKWQLGSMLATKNCQVISITDYDKVQEINLTKASVDTKHVIIRAVAKGKPMQQTNTIHVGDKSYKI